VNANDKNKVIKGMNVIYQFSKYWVAIVLLLVFAACEDQLEKEPFDAFATTTFWTSEENALIALNAAYRGNILANAASFNANDWWDYNGLLWLELATDNAYDRRLDNSVNNILTNGTMTPNLALLPQYWNASYKRIARCNDFLENIGQVPLAETRKKRMVAEIRFLRACQYFYLSQYFRSVPLVTKTLTLQEANTISRASHQEVVGYALAEFAAAAADLPRFKDIPNAEIGRASKQAALAFLGRLQLGEDLFAEAAQTYKSIIDLGDNLIDPNYSSIFLESNENSAENIFSIQFVPNLLSNGILQHHAPSIMGGFSLVNPLANLVEAYQFTDGTPFSYADPRYDYKDIGKNRDPRLRYTILYDGAPVGNKRYVSHPDSTTSVEQVQSPVFQSTKTGYGQLKFIDVHFTGNLQTGYGGNLPIIRYAEVLLSYVEAKLEAGQPIDQALLDATINKVRGRASVNMPPITETNPAVLRPILRNERRVELALEGIRLWDLLRWKIADQVLKGDFYGHPYPVSKRAIRKKNAAAPADPYKRWYVTTKNFRKGMDETWPIPQSEVNINPNLAK
jgi:starch-binding outer membrane protein, SusD/RagB family